MNLLYSVFISVLISSCQNAEHSPEKINAKIVVANYLETIGGEEAVNQVTTLRKSGHYVEPAYNIIIPADLQKRRPNYRLIGNAETVGFEEGYNGEAWEFHRGKGLIMSEGESKEVILISSEFDHPFINALEKGHRMSYQGKTLFNGAKVHDLEVLIEVMGTDYRTHYYFDEHSFLLLGQHKIMPIHAQGDDVDIIVSYSDYRAVNGVFYPFSFIERNKKTGDFLNATIWNSIETGVDIPLEIFDPPSSEDLLKRPLVFVRRDSDKYHLKYFVNSVELSQT